MTAKTIKTVKLSKVIEAPVAGNLMVLFLPRYRRQQIGLFAGEGNKPPRLLSWIPFDENMVTNYDFFRLISAGLRIKSDTVSSSNFTLGGQLNEVLFSVLPNVLDVNNDNVLSYARGNNTYAASIPLADGVTLLASPDRVGLDMLQPDDPMTVADVTNTATAVISNSVFGVTSQREGVIVQGQGENCGYVPVRPWAPFEWNELWSSTASSVGFPANMVGRFTAKFQIVTNVLSQPWTLKFRLRFTCPQADPNNYSEVGVDYVQLIDYVSNTRPTFNWNETVQLQFYGTVPAFVESIHLEASAPSSDEWGSFNYANDDESNTFEFQWKDLSDEQGLIGPGHLTTLTGVSAGQQISLAAVMNYEAVPNAALARNLKITYPPMYDPNAMKLVSFLFNQVPEYRTIYTNSEYQDLLIRMVGQLVSDSTMESKAADWGFFNFLKPIGKVASQVIGGGLGLIGHPTIGGIVSTIGDKVFSRDYRVGARDYRVGARDYRKGKTSYSSDRAKSLYTKMRSSDEKVQIMAYCPTCGNHTSLPEEEVKTPAPTEKVQKHVVQKSLPTQKKLTNRGRSRASDRGFLSRIFTSAVVPIKGAVDESVKVVKAADADHIPANYVIVGAKGGLSPWDLMNEVNKYISAVSGALSSYEFWEKVEAIQARIMEGSQSQGGKNAKYVLQEHFITIKEDSEGIFGGVRDLFISSEPLAAVYGDKVVYADYVQDVRTVKVEGTTVDVKLYHSTNLVDKLTLYPDIIAMLISNYAVGFKNLFSESIYITAHADPRTHGEAFDDMIDGHSWMAAALGCLALNSADLLFTGFPIVSPGDLMEKLAVVDGEWAQNRKARLYISGINSEDIGPLNVFLESRKKMMMSLDAEELFFSPFPIVAIFSEVKGFTVGREGDGTISLEEKMISNPESEGEMVQACVREIVNIMRTDLLVRPTAKITNPVKQEVSSLKAKNPNFHRAVALFSGLTPPEQDYLINEFTTKNYRLKDKLLFERYKPALDELSIGLPAHKLSEDELFTLMMYGTSDDQMRVWDTRLMQRTREKAKVVQKEQSLKKQGRTYVPKPSVTKLQ
jgi:hypothetical protein